MKEASKTLALLSDGQRNEILLAVAGAINEQKEKLLEAVAASGKSIDEVIQTAIGGRIDDNIAKKEEVDDLSINVESSQKNIAAVSAAVNDIKMKQQELFKVVTDLQDQVASEATIRQENEPVPATQPNVDEDPIEQED